MNQLELFMNKFISTYGSSPFARPALITVFVAIIFFTLRFLCYKWLERNDKMTIEEKIKMKSNISLYSKVFFLFLLVFLWFAQIQTVLVSVLAIAAAIVLATKELIMCFMGGLFIRFNKSLRVGDRIEIDETRGFVVDRSLTAIKVLEIGPEATSQQTTGRMIILPNSLVLSHTLKNESYFQGYTIKSFRFLLTEGMKLQELEKNLIKWGNEVSSDILAEASYNINKFCMKENLYIPSVDPRTRVAIDNNETIIILKLPVKSTNVSDVEQFLVRKYITFKEGISIKEKKFES